MKKSFSILLVLSVILGFSLGWTDALSAASEKAPISGTPMLREQKLMLLRDYGTSAPDQTRKRHTWRFGRRRCSLLCL